MKHPPSKPPTFGHPQYKLVSGQGFLVWGTYCPSLHNGDNVWDTIEDDEYWGGVVGTIGLVTRTSRSGSQG
jgi:hypothetical protein